MCITLVEYVPLVYISSSSSSSSAHRKPPAGTNATGGGCGNNLADNSMQARHEAGGYSRHPTTRVEQGSERSTPGEARQTRLDRLGRSVGGTRTGTEQPESGKVRSSQGESIDRTSQIKTKVAVYAQVLPARSL